MRTYLTIMAMTAIAAGQLLTMTPAFAEGTDAGPGYADQQAAPVSHAEIGGQAQAGYQAPPANQAPAGGQVAADDHGDGKVYEGKHGYHRKECGGNGIVGTLAGGIGGGILGDLLIGAGPVGILIGGVGGALLGRHFDKKHTASGNHC